MGVSQGFSLSEELTANKEHLLSAYLSTKMSSKNVTCIHAFNPHNPPEILSECHFGQIMLVWGGW